MGSAGFTLTVTGGNFVPGSLVRWKGLERSTTFASGNVLTAAIPASDLNEFEPAQVVVSSGLDVSNSAVFAIYRALSLSTNDLIFDPTRNRIYASIPGSIRDGNSIVSIDPFTASIGTPVPIGSEPSRLALSDNGQYLYTALDGAGAVRRLDLASQTPGCSFL